MTSSEMGAERVGLALVGFQWAALIVLALLEEYHTRRHERDNAVTRASNQETVEKIDASNRLVIAAIRQHFPRWQDEDPEEEMPL